MPSSSIAAANREVKKVVDEPADLTTKRGTYEHFTPEEKALIGKRAAEFGIRNSIRYFSMKFPGPSSSLRAHMQVHWACAGPHLHYNWTGAPSAKVFSAKFSLCTQLQKFSPSKVFRYTVLPPTYSRDLFYANKEQDIEPTDEGTWDHSGEKAQTLQRTTAR